MTKEARQLVDSERVEVGSHKIGRGKQERVGVCSRIAGEPVNRMLTRHAASPPRFLMVVATVVDALLNFAPALVTEPKLTFLAITSGFKSLSARLFSAIRPVITWSPKNGSGSEFVLWQYLRPTAGLDAAIGLSIDLCADAE